MRRASLGAIFLTILLDLLGFGLVFPFLSDEARTVFGTSEFVGTLLASVYSMMQFLCAPLWGRLSDRIGRKPVLTISVGMTALSMLGLGSALAWGTSIVTLFAARILGGAATANLGVGSAYIADVTKPEDRAKGMALFGVAFGLGFILGPAVGGLLAEITVNGRHGPLACFVAAALSVVNLVWVGFGLPESLPKERRDEAAARRAETGRKGVFGALSDKPMQLVVLTKKGRQAFDAAMRLQAPWSDRLSAGLAAKDLETAHRVMLALRDNLSARDEEDAAEDERARKARKSAEAPV